MHAQLHCSIADRPGYLRVVYFCDKRTNNLATSLTSIYDTSSPDILSFQNLENSPRYKILSDVTTSIMPGCRKSNGDPIDPDFIRTYHMPLGNLTTRYSSDLNNIGDISDLSLQCIVFVHNVAATVAIKSRVRYYG